MSVLNEIKNILFRDFPSENISILCHVVFGGIEKNIHSEKILTDELESLNLLLNNNGYTNSSIVITDCESLIKGPFKHQKHC